MLLVKSEDIKYGTVTSKKDAILIVKNKYGDSIQECVIMVGIDNNLEVKCIHEMFKGGISMSVVDIKIVFKYLLLSDNVVSFIILHNHPSGNMKPSSSDMQVAKKLLESSKIMDFEMLDFIIFNKDNEYSFKENNTMFFL